jgi:hypothetical protein
VALSSASRARLFSFPPPLGARRLLGILSDARGSQSRADRFCQVINPAPVLARGCAANRPTALPL